MSGSSPEQIKAIAQHIENTPIALNHLITELSQRHPHRRLLLVIDQFEELITLEPVYQLSTTENRSGLLSWFNRREKLSSESHQETSHKSLSEEQHVSRWQRFSQTLAATLKTCPQLHVLVTLRSDFSARFHDSALSERWAAARFVVRPMRSDELREAVVGPANEMALYFEPSSLVDRLVDEVAQTPGALPLLSFTLSELYLKLYDAWHTEGREDRALSIDQDFDKQGGVAGLLALRANEEYALLPDDAHRQTMQRVMLRMVDLESIEATKRRVPKTELVYADDAENKRVDTVLNRLDQARLIVGGDDAGVSYVELAHDFLVRGWDMLQNWIREEPETLALQRLLIPAVKNWRERNTDLWNGNSRLVTLKQIKNSGKSWFNKAETDFVKQSLLRKRKNMQLRVLGFVGLLAASFVTAGVVRTVNQDAEVSRQEAIKQRDIATERGIETKRRRISTLVSNANSELEAGRFSDALIFAIQAGAIVKDEPSFYSDQALKNLVTTTLYSTYYGAGKTVNRSERYDLAGEPSDIAMQAYYAIPGELASIDTAAGIATSIENRGVTIWEITSGTVLLEKQLEYQPDRVILLPNQGSFATVSSNSEARSVDFWSIETGDPVLAKEILHSLDNSNLSTMPSSVLESLLLATDAGLDIEKLTTTVGIERLSRFSKFVLSPSFDWLAGYTESDIVLINLTNTNEIQLDTMSENVGDDSESSDETTPRSEPAEDTVPLSVGERDIIADDIAFGLNGDTVVTVGGINEVRTWSLSGKLLTTNQFDAELCNTLPTFGASPVPYIVNNTARLSTNGRTLAVACGNGAVRIWDTNKAMTAPLAIKIFSGTGGNTNVPRSFSSISFDRHLPIIGIENTLDGKTITQFIRLEPEKTIQPVAIDRIAYDFTFAPDNNIATIEEDGYVSLWDSDGNELQNFLVFEEGHNFFLGNFGGIRDGGLLGLTYNRPRIKFDASGQLIAVASGPSVKVINRSGNVLHNATNPEAVQNLGFSSDQSQIIVVGATSLSLFDTQNNSLQSVPENWIADSYGVIYASEISPDGKWLVIAVGEDRSIDSRSVQLIDILNQTSYVLLENESASNVRELLFDADSSYLSIGKSRDARVQFWDVNSRTPIEREIKVNTRTLVSSSLHSSKELFAVTTGQATPGKTLSIGTQLVTFDGTILLELEQLELEKVLFDDDSSLFGTLRLKNDGRGTRFDGLLLWDFSLEALLSKSCEQLDNYLNSPLLNETDRSTCDSIRVNEASAND